MKRLTFILTSILALALFSCGEKYPDLEDGLYAEFITNQGTFVAKLYEEQAPLTIANFVSLAEGTNTMVDSTYKGKNFYNGLIFHRVIKDFMIQGGDPEGTGRGGPGYKFPDETTESLAHNDKGILSMANSGPNTNGSQFFVTVKATPWLDGRHTIFGKVMIGQEVVDTIGKVETTKPGDKPVEDVVINELNIIKKGSKYKKYDGAKAYEETLKNIETSKIEEAKRLEEVKMNKAKEIEALKKEATTYDSGLSMVITTEGEGPKPNTGDAVTVNYAGYLEDGTLFDSNIEKISRTYNIFNANRKKKDGYTPMPTLYSPDAGLIQGFKDAMQMMKVGDKATVFIPSHLAYGERGAGQAIKPNTDLVFELELVEITPKTKK